MTRRARRNKIARVMGGAFAAALMLGGSVAVATADPTTESERAAAIDLQGDRDGVAEFQDDGRGGMIGENEAAWNCETMGNRTC